MKRVHEPTCLLVRNLDLARVDAIDNIMRRLTINRAPNALCRSQNLLHTSRQLFRQRLCFHCSRNVKDFVQRHVSTVFDIFFFFAVTRGL